MNWIIITLPCGNSATGLRELNCDAVLQSAAGKVPGIQLE